MVYCLCLLVWFFFRLCQYISKPFLLILLSFANRSLSLSCNLLESYSLPSRIINSNLSWPQSVIQCSAPNSSDALTASNPPETAVHTYRTLIHIEQVVRRHHPICSLCVCYFYPQSTATARRAPYTVSTSASAADHQLLRLYVILRSLLPPGCNT